MVNFLYNFLINGKIILGDKPHACKNKYHRNQEYIARSAPTNISGFFQSYHCIVREKTLEVYKIFEVRQRVRPKNDYRKK